MKRLTIWTAIALCALSCVATEPVFAQGKRAPTPTPHKTDHNREAQRDKGRESAQTNKSERREAPRPNKSRR
jgi:hypothetical protein